MFPAYDFKMKEGEAASDASDGWPAVKKGTTVAGLVGGAGVLTAVAAVGFLLRGRRKVSA